MSTFSGLNTAYTGLVAARLGLDITGQNISNAKTEGYTRQRVDQSSIGPVANTGMLDHGARPGQGVFVDGIGRIGNSVLDARVRATASQQGYWLARAEAFAGIEGTLREPGDKGISNDLNEFWAAWQELGNRAGDSAAGATLLQTAQTLVSKISSGYRELETQWSTLRSEIDSIAGEVNGTARQIADLNAAIRNQLTSGGSANELIDKRNVLAERLASLAGGVVRDRGDGTVDVTVGGNAIVSGTTSREVAVTGAHTLHELQNGSAPTVQLTWAGSGTPIALDGGRLGGALSALAPAANGSGGPIAEAAAQYNALATQLAASVNAVHQQGATAAGTTGLDFFSVDASQPPALALGVIPTSLTDIAAGAPGTGGLNGDIADAIASIGKAPDSPDSLWSSFVTATGVASRAEKQQSDLADLAKASATSRQLSEASVDLDEENLNLLMFQHAYQGAARVMTAMDEMLDTLINRMGLVGR